MGQGFFDVHARLNRPPEREVPAAPAQTLTVSQLTNQIERVLKSGLPAQVLVKGEVSNHRYHGQSGHHYFTLKDDGACMPCVMFRGDAARLKFDPRDGLELLATGRVGVYPQQGKYQLYVTALSPIGQGALELALQQMREKLEKEGLFSAERKRPIPLYPTRVALVTGLGTAAIQDMFKVFSRFPFVKLSVFNVPVQGDGAAEKIADAIATLSNNRLRLGIALIILARGGGSLEDLWEFNEEVVARAMCASSVPVVTGIGHEIDTSIADLCADYFAHTPTEAAQVVTQHWRMAADAVATGAIRLRRGLAAIVYDVRQQLAGVERHEFFRRPLDRVGQLRQLIDDRQRALSMAIHHRLHTAERQVAVINDRLQRHRPQEVLARRRQQVEGLRHSLGEALSQLLRRASDRLQCMVLQLRESHPRHRVELHRQQTTGLEQRLTMAGRRDIERRQTSLTAIEGRLNALSPQSVFRRGYTMTTLKKTGAVIRNASELRERDRIVTRFAEGTRESIVTDGRQLPLFE